ncbi:hypothetical protein AB0N05_21855 [Nocardia sp. NPDC051030]|uniref:hypothetical protein n=1 Tax=Nocardia sp. NPDC051030 TaxID=3155162 RepID=UPI00343DEE13
MDEDEFAPGERDVPLNFHTDGTWVWSGSVANHLNKHRLPPEPELVQHIAARGFRLYEVNDAMQERAVRVITGV